MLQVKIFNIQYLSTYRTTKFSFLPFSVEYFDLSFNMFEGPTPLPQGQAALVIDAGLCGHPLSKECINRTMQSVVPRYSKKNDVDIMLFLFFWNWIRARVCDCVCTGNGESLLEGERQEALLIMHGFSCMRICNQDSPVKCHYCYCCKMIVLIYPFIRNCSVFFIYYLFEVLRSVSCSSNFFL
jgi:hypothetical protein